MIKLVRLDERLLHGQIAQSWLTALDIDSVVIVDDFSATNELAKHALMMAIANVSARKNFKTVIKTIDAAITLLNDPRCSPKKIFVITNQLDYLERIINEVPDIKEINIGNYGTLQDTYEQRKEIIPHLLLNTNEVEMMKRMMKKFEFYFQITPEKIKYNLKYKL